MTDDVASILKVSEGRLKTVRDIQFADIEKQGFMPVYERQKITDELHKLCSFRTDYLGYNKTKNERDSEKSKRRESIIIFQVQDTKCHTPSIFKDCGTFFLY